MATSSPPDVPVEEEEDWRRVYAVRVAPHLADAVSHFTECASSSDGGTPDDRLARHYVEAVPKTDLHAHVNGSVSSALLSFLERRQRGASAAEACQRRDEGADDAARACGAAGGGGGGDKGDSNGTAPVLEGLFFSSAKRSDILSNPHLRSSEDKMNYCFRVFDNIYRVMGSLAATRLAVQDLLLAYARDSTLLLELRTSLRRGLRRSLDDAGGGAQDDAASLEEYVDAVTGTAELLLSGGGVVCFETGELWRVDAVSALTGMAERCLSLATTADGAAGETEERFARWWAIFSELYSSTLLAAPLPARAWLHPHISGPLAAAIADGESAAARLVCARHLFVTVRDRMHVRLLLSLNRANHSAAQRPLLTETIALARRTQRRQVRAFFASYWDKTHQPSAAAAAQTTDVAGWLRREVRRRCWVVGIDLSGNCYKGDYAADLAQVARTITDPFAADSGGGEAAAAAPTPALLRMTTHAGEKKDEAELRAMIDDSCFALWPEPAPRTGRSGTLDTSDSPSCPRPVAARLRGGGVTARWGHLVYTGLHTLSCVLLLHQPVELCLTSNLLTGGHACVAAHHLGHMATLWHFLRRHDARLEAAEGDTAGGEPEGRPRLRVSLRVDAGRGGGGGGGGTRALIPLDDAEAEAFVRTHRLSLDGDGAAAAEPSFVERLLDAATYRATLACRLAARRARFVCAAPHNGDAELLAAAPARALPNLSLHTDDRGVFDVSVTSEWLLGLRHAALRPPPAAAREDTGDDNQGAAAAAAAEVVWALSRLSLAQSFDLPLPVLLLLLLTVAAPAHARPAAETEGSTAEQWGRRLQACLSQCDKGGCAGDADRGLAAVLDACNEALFDPDTAAGESPVYRPVVHQLTALSAQLLTEDFDSYMCE